MTERPLRSVLYMPGSKPRALEKARSLPADALILDLEDAVAPAGKSAARAGVAAALAEGGFGRRMVIVRINGLDTEWGADDLKMAAAAAPDAILVPKVSHPADLARVEAGLGQAPARTRLWAMMETPAGILNAAATAGATPRLGALVLGTNDLVKDLGARHDPARLAVLTALGLCLLAARAHGLACIDGVHNAFQDETGLREVCVQGRDMGFDGKTLIHPAQLAVANAVFAPAPDELALARRHVAAWEAALVAGQGVAVVDGQIVENLHVETARRMLARAAAIAELEAEAG